MSDQYDAGFDGVGFDDGGPIEELFTAFRQGGPLAVPAGPDAARAVIRRRRRMRAGAGAVALAILLVAVPALAMALPDDSSPAPAVTPTAEPSVSPAPDPSVTATPSTTPSATAAPDGRISAAELGRSTLDLPSWPRGLDSDCPAGQVRFRGGVARLPGNERQVRQDKVLHLDIDRDGAQETIAHIRCGGLELHESKVVAFDRDSDGRIVTMGEVLASEGDVASIFTIRSAGRAVEAEVVDYFGDGLPEDVPQRQWRAYSWTGTGFAQSGGPTRFPPNPKVTDLAISGGDLVLGRHVGGWWTGKLTFDIRNKGPQRADSVRVSVSLPKGSALSPLPRNCLVRSTSWGVTVDCDLPALAVGASRQLVLSVSNTEETPSDEYSANVRWLSAKGGTPYPEPAGKATDNVINRKVVASG